jgi:hypothetical protein
LEGYCLCPKLFNAHAIPLLRYINSFGSITYLKNPGRVTIKKMDVLQLALQLNFWVVKDTYNSLYLYVVNVNRQVARTTKLQFNRQIAWAAKLQFNRQVAWAAKLQFNRQVAWATKLQFIVYMTQLLATQL